MDLVQGDTFALPGGQPVHPAQAQPGRQVQDRHTLPGLVAPVLLPDCWSGRAMPLVEKNISCRSNATASCSSRSGNSSDGNGSCRIESSSSAVVNATCRCSVCDCAQRLDDQAGVPGSALELPVRGRRPSRGQQQFGGDVAGVGAGHGERRGQHLRQRVHAQPGAVAEALVRACR